MRLYLQTGAEQASRNVGFLKCFKNFRPWIKSKEREDIVIELFAIFKFALYKSKLMYKGKVTPRQAEVAQGLAGRLRPQIFSTFRTTRVVGRQPKAPAAFTPGEIPGNHFQRLRQPQGTWFCRKEPRKKFQVTPPGIDPETVRLVTQRLNHYATPGPQIDVQYY